MKILPQIQKDLDTRLKYFKDDLGDVVKYERLKTKVEYDIEMMQEVGYVNGIENYSRYLDKRKPGAPAATLMDYFGKDSLTLIDESHMTISQIGAMYGGDRSRKENLVNNGFRLPSAMDNRPLKFEEFESKIHNVIAVSATPARYEIEQSCDSEKLSEEFFDFDPIAGKDWKQSEKKRVIPQVIRPTGLLDPEITLKSMDFMVDDIMNQISEIEKLWERMLITTLTKRSSEELTEYLLENWVKVQYLHSEVDTLDRIEILKDLRIGKIDVIVGVNLLREWLDLPEVSKIAILDADKQWFLRSVSALVQIVGRAARNSKGIVSMYVEKMTKKTQEKLFSKEYETELVWERLWRTDKGKFINKEWLVISEAMKKAISLTYYRRGIQQEYNEKNNITPTTIFSSIKDIGIPNKKKWLDIKDRKSAERELQRLELEMDIAAANMEYEKAAELRDEILEIKKWKRKLR